jgi:hypothetical protein
MMMVVVQPRELSLKFNPDDQVKVSSETGVRLGPGSNYAVVDNVAAGSQGVILEHANGLNGVWAKDNYWWKVKFDNADGWVTEASISSGKLLRLPFCLECLSE